MTDLQVLIIGALCVAALAGYLVLCDRVRS
jgi:hypothetical protein